MCFGCLFVACFFINLIYYNNLMLSQLINLEYSIIYNTPKNNTFFIQ